MRNKVKWIVQVKAKRFCSWVLVLCMCIFCFPIKEISAQGIGSWIDEDNYAASFASGSGTQGDPFIIETAGQLALFARGTQPDQTTYNTKHFKIADGVTEINLSAHEWTPIAAFTGSFDGNGSVITGLNIGTSTAPETALIYAGLFARIVGGAVVKNICLENIAIYMYKGLSQIGGIAGNCDGATINCCSVTGTIQATTDDSEATIRTEVGGIVGRSYSRGSNPGRILNCSSGVNITAVSGGIGTLKVGGISGYHYSMASAPASIVNSYNTGNLSVTRGTNVGGIVGNATMVSGFVTEINNCYNTGTITVDTGTVGGIIGTMNAITVQNCYWLTGTAVSGIGVGSAETTDMTLDEMQNDNFAIILTANASMYNTAVGENIADEWLYQDGAFPKLSTVVASGRVLSVSVNSAVMGTVTVYIWDEEQNAYAEVSSSSLVMPGCLVKLVIEADSSFLLESLMVSGEVQTLTDNSYEFVMPDQFVQVSAVFTVASYYEASPIYVDAEAEINGDGTQSSPFNSLEAAQNSVRLLLINHPTANVTVYLMGGTYCIDETMQFDASDASLGTVIYRNYENETAVISGASGIAGQDFEQVTGELYYRYQLNEDEKVGGEYPFFRDLLVNGERAILARTSDQLFSSSYRNQILDGSKVESCDNAMYVDVDLLDGITNEDKGKLEIVSLVEWKSQLFHIGTIGSTTDGQAEISIVDDEWQKYYDWDTTKKSLVGRKYWLQNHLNFLDEPGEFYYDQEIGIIYYYPYGDQDMDYAVMEYPLLDQLINLQDTSNTTFDGITFTGTTSRFVEENGLAGILGNCYMRMANDPGTNIACAAIFADYAEGIKVLNCTFKELGGTGVLFNYGCKNIGITGNAFTNLAMGAIVVGVNEREWGVGGSENIAITNNYITNIGIDFRGAAAIKVARTDHLSILNNTIIHVPYSGIMAGWGWNLREPMNTNLNEAEIAYNWIEDFLYEINDGGGIYTCGANDWPSNTELFNSIHDNYIKGNAYNKTYTGIYHDGSASNWHTYHNVVDDFISTKGPMFFQDDVASQNTHNITAENNFTTISSITSSANASRNIQLNNNTVVADRSQLSEEALNIILDAGIEGEYGTIASPMATEMKLEMDTIHLTVTKEQTAAAVLKITNNSDIEKTYQLSLSDPLPENTSFSFLSDNITLAPGATGNITITFSAIDSENVEDSLRAVIGINFTDSTGRKQAYPRAISVATSAGEDSMTIAKATPTIDGILDEAYRSSAKINFGSIFYPTAGAESDLTGYCYLLWDEDYLYCYAAVSESTVMSRGTDWIETTWETTHPWANDNVETYIATSAKINGAKVAVDAFGVNCYGHFAKELHAILPYAAAFTYNGSIIENYSIPEPTAGQLASTESQPVNGYVIEMTLPIAEALGVTGGIPVVGDIIQFKIQNNDMQNNTPYIVALTTALSSYTLGEES